MTWNRIYNGRDSSGWHTVLTITHPNEISPWVSHRMICSYFVISSGYLRVALRVIPPWAKSSGWLAQMVLCHPDDLGWHQISSGWQTTWSAVSRMIQHQAQSHPDDLLTMQYVNRITYHKMLPEIIRMTSSLVISYADDLRPLQYVICVTCDDILSRPDEGSWLYVIRMTYVHHIISSRWHTMTPSHLVNITEFV